jgi:hypothetical protein
LAHQSQSTAYHETNEPIDGNHVETQSSGAYRKSIRREFPQSDPAYMAGVPVTFCTIRHIGPNEATYNSANATIDVADFGQIGFWFALITE